MTDFAPEHQQLIDSVPTPEGFELAEETVDYDHDGTPLEGYLAYDASLPTPLPGILVVHDWTGLQEYPKARAQMLARLGYAAFAVDLYGRGVRPTGDDAATEARKYYGDLPLLRARMQAGYDRLVADDRVDGARVAAMGYCFGGSATLEFARTGAPLKGFASFHGGLQAKEPAEVDRIQGPLLIATGAADPVVPDEAVVAFENELRTRDDLDWQLTSYSGAPHAFTLPLAGDAYRPAADRRSWRALTDFLDEVLPARS